MQCYFNHGSDSHSPINVFVKHKQVSVVLSYLVAVNVTPSNSLHDFLGLTPSVVDMKLDTTNFI